MWFLNQWHRVAVICGAGPLLLGTGIFLAWLVVRWDWLMMAGGVVLYVGLAGLAYAERRGVSLDAPPAITCHVMNSPLNHQNP